MCPVAPAMPAFLSYTQWRQIDTTPQSGDYVHACPPTSRGGLATRTTTTQPGYPGRPVSARGRQPGAPSPARHRGRLADRRVDPDEQLGEWAAFEQDGRGTGAMQPPLLALE